MHPDGTVSFTCMRTIPRDDTVTSMRFPASSRVFGKMISGFTKTLQFHKNASVSQKRFSFTEYRFGPFETKVELQSAQSH